MDWLDQGRRWRQRFVLAAGEHGHFERAVALQPAEPVASPQLVEVDADGRLLDADICLQPSGADLLFHLRGRTKVGRSRHYQLYFNEAGSGDDEPAKWAGPVSVSAVHEHEGFASVSVETPGATWIYHMDGGGFAGLVDGSGLDWISFHPWGGSDGNFRGIPNLVHPESFFHPGRSTCRSEVIESGPLRCVIRSGSADDAWLCEWTIEPDCARLAVLKAARPYWMLYEGTPGGALDERGDFMLLGDGRRIAASERWEMESLPEPGWIAFGASSSPRALWLMRHVPDGDADSYWPMEGNMTVFGYGRSGLTRSLTRAPAHFSVGLAEVNDYQSLSAIIHAGSSPPQLQLGEIERIG